VTVYGEVEFIIRISPFQERYFSQLTIKIEAAGSIENSVHIIFYKNVIPNLRLFIDAFRTSGV